MSVDERLKRINKEVSTLPEKRGESFLRWAVAWAGVPLHTEATFEALASRISSYKEGIADRVLERLEEGLELA